MKSNSYEEYCRLTSEERDRDLLYIIRNLSRFDSIDIYAEKDHDRLAATGEERSQWSVSIYEGTGRFSAENSNFEEALVKTYFSAAHYVEKEYQELAEKRKKAIDKLSDEDLKLLNLHPRNRYIY